MFFIREQRCVQSHTSVNTLSMGTKPGLRLRYLGWLCYGVLGCLTVLPPKRRCYFVINTHYIRITPPPPKPKHTHAYTHTRIHTHMHTHTRIHTHSHTHTCTNIRSVKVGLVLSSIPFVFRHFKQYLRLCSHY